jgi:hypothetical protein
MKVSTVPVCTGKTMAETEILLRNAGLTWINGQIDGTYIAGRYVEGNYIAGSYSGGSMVKSTLPPAGEECPWGTSVNLHWARFGQ